MEKMGLNKSKAFWNNKKVFITGHTGFKGSWLSIFLINLGAEVTGFSLDPINEKDNFTKCRLSNSLNDIRGDIRDEDTLDKAIEKYRPDIIFHLAAQPIVRVSYEKPKETYETNVMGTLNLLNSFKNSISARACIIVTTDKCYENKEQIWGYRETDALGGYDPYSASKACAEIMVASYRNSFFSSLNQKAVATARAGNVIGGGDWSKDRLIPDCIASLEEKIPINIRNSKSVRPWQHVIEPLWGYMLLAEQLWREPYLFSESWNFGPDNNMYCVKDVVEMLIKRWGSGHILYQKEEKAPHETSLLLLDSTKAKMKLGWKPFFDIETAINLTADWYKHYKTENMFNFCAAQIEQYLKHQI